MRHWLARLLLVLGAAAPAACTAEAPFDYWVLALSWSPQYCASNGSPDELQCTRAYHFVVHGLWPQYEVGYPKDCGRVPGVPDELVDRMLPLMPSARLIEHEWRKHGACSGLDVREYFLQTERARRRVTIPTAYESPGEPIRTDAREIERRFIEANAGLTPDGIALSCSGRWLSEARICLDPQFGFRACGRDVRDRCRGEVMIRPSAPGRSAR